MPLHQIALGAWHLDVWTLFGRLPLALCVVLLLAGGHKRQWPWRANVLATAAFAAGLSLGTWLLPSVLGALAGGMLLWFAAQRLLALRDPPLTALAIGVTALIAIGRVGCLLTGCCFGRPTDLPWGVHYGAGSFALALHRALGDVAPDALQSLAVHPYPLYESLGLGVWLLLLLALARRLRSQGAVLAATAAFDLALRSGIDGHRAMINVWWAATGSWLGIDRFRWLLAAAALLSLALAWRLEVHARTRGAQPAAAAVPVVAPQVAWALYLALWLVALATRFGATPLLHWTLLAALAVGALALPVPAWLAGRDLQWLGPVTALLLLVPLLLPRAVQADAGGSVPLAADATRTWLYVPVPQQKALVRVGSNQDARDIIQQRESALGVPLPRPPTPSERQVQVWVGGAGTFGVASYTTQSSCGGTSSVENHVTTAATGSGMVDVQIPVLESSSVHIGARAGYAGSSDAVSSTSTTGQTRTQGATTHTSTSTTTDSAVAMTGWVEFENEYIALGAGALYWPYISGQLYGDAFMPAGHVRLGFPILSVDAGLNDRLAFTPTFSWRLGLTTMGPTVLDADPAQSTRWRLFAGMQTFPTAIAGLARVGFAASLDAEYHGWLGGGVQCAAGEAMFCGLAFRVNVLHPTRR